MNNIVYTIRVWKQKWEDRQLMRRLNRLRIEAGLWTFDNSSFCNEHIEAILKDTAGYDNVLNYVIRNNVKSYIDIYIKLLRMTDEIEHHYPWSDESKKVLNKIDSLIKQLGEVFYKVRYETWAFDCPDSIPLDDKLLNDIMGLNVQPSLFLDIN